MARKAGQHNKALLDRKIRESTIGDTESRSGANIRRREELESIKEDDPARYPVPQGTGPAGEEAPRCG